MLKEKDLKLIVQRILTNHIDARGNDNKLYYYFFLEEYHTTDLAVISEMSFNKFASVSRYRQLIQNQMPWLRPSEITQTRRKQREMNYREKLSKQL